MNLVHSSLTVGAERAAALAALGSPPRRTSASHSWASERACSTVSSPYRPRAGDRKSTRLNSSHLGISYAVFCLKKKKKTAFATAAESSCARVVLSAKAKVHRDRRVA